MNAQLCSEGHLKLTPSPAECDHRLPPLPYGGRTHLQPQPTAPALEFVDVAIGYPTTQRLVISDVSVSVARGQSVALVGPNGAGKSTLLKAAAGLIRPSSGTIRVYGNAVGTCYHRIAYLPQRSEVDWHFPISVFDLVMTGRYVHLGWLQRPKASDKELTLAALDRLSIGDLANRQLTELSGGQQQRALIARALVQQASLFLLDEPLNGVDEVTRDIVDQVLSDHIKVGGSVLVATHDLDRLCESFEVVVHLKEGRAHQIEHLPSGSFATSTAASGNAKATNQGSG